MDDIAYRRAAARVEARLAFYRHAMIWMGSRREQMIQRELERQERWRQSPPS